MNKEELKKLIVLIILQLLTFYLLPLFMKTTGPMGLVLIIVIITFMFSLILGVSLTSGLKFLYPVLVAVVFLPSVYLFYNDSALIHTVWYFVISLVGLLLGTLVQTILKRIVISNKK